MRALGPALGLVFVACAWLGRAGELTDDLAGLASRGLFDSAQALLEIAKGNGAAQADPEKWNLLSGKLELQGYRAAKFWKGLKESRQTSSEQAQALYLLGQYQYAAGRYHLAIPEFREYFRRYPRGEDADRAGYWMANACLHLALTQSGREAYLDTAFLYLEKMPAQTNPRSFYAPLATECAARLYLAKSQPLIADSIAAKALPKASRDEKPALWLLRSLALRAAERSYRPFLDSLLRDYPRSPEAQYANRFHNRLPLWPTVKPADSLPNPREGAMTPAADENKPMARFRLQIGSFSQPENAHSLARQMRQKGMTVALESTEVNGKDLIQVFIGPFPNEASAQAFGEEKLRPLHIVYQLKAEGN